MTQTKCCTKCKQDRPISQFSIDRQKRDGFRPSCKTCDLANRPAILIAARRWKQRNADAVKKYKKEHRPPNKGRPPKDLTAPARAKSLWKKRNPHRVSADHAERRAREHGAKPSWANSFFIQEAYRLAKLREAATGFKWHVDHMVPLRGKTVCGLHVHHNLQVIPAKQNYKKGCTVWPDMP